MSENKKERINWNMIAAVATILALSLPLLWSQVNMQDAWKQVTRFQEANAGPPRVESSRVWFEEVAQPNPLIRRIDAHVYIEIVDGRLRDFITKVVIHDRNGCYVSDANKPFKPLFRTDYIQDHMIGLSILDTVDDEHFAPPLTATFFVIDKTTDEIIHESGPFSLDGVLKPHRKTRFLLAETPSSAVSVSIFNVWIEETDPEDSEDTKFYVRVSTDIPDTRGREEIWVQADLYDSKGCFIAHGAQGFNRGFKGGIVQDKRLQLFRPGSDGQPYTEPLSLVIKVGDVELEEVYFVKRFIDLEERKVYDPDPRYPVKQ